MATENQTLKTTVTVDMTQFQKAMNTMSSSLESFGKKMESVGKSLTASLSLPLAGIGTLAVKTSVDFDSAMRKVQATTGATSSDMEELTAKAREMGKMTTKSASESADAMNYMAMAGWDTTQILAGIEPVLRLAEASCEDFATVSDIVTDGLTAFGLKAEDTGKFTDLLANVSRNANTNVSMLGESFKYVAPVAGAFGYSAEDTAKALGLMANAGIKSSQAGTSLRGALSRLAKPTQAMSTTMDELGISLTNSDGTMKTLSQVMDNLRDKMGNLTEAQQIETATVLFGQEAMSGMLAIVNASEKDYEKLTSATTTYSGACEEMANTMNGGLGGAFATLKSMFEDIMITIGDRLAPVVWYFVDVLKNVMDGFNNLSEPVQNIILLLGGLGIVIPPLLMALGVLFGTVIPAIISGFTALVSPIGLAIGLFVTLMLTSEQFREVVILVFQQILEVIISVAQQIVDFLSLAWETIRMVSEIIFGSLRDYFIENQTQILAFFTEVWTTLSNFLSAIFNFIYEVAVAVFTTIKDWFTENGEQLKTLFKYVWDTILGTLQIAWGIIKDIATYVFTWLSDFWAEHGETITNLFTRVWNLITQIFQGALSLICNIVRIVATTIQFIWENFGQTIMDFISLTWDRIASIFMSASQILIGILDVFMGLFTGNWSQMWEGVKSIFTGIMEGIKGGVKGMVNFIITMVNGCISGVNTMISGVNFIPGVNIPKIPNIPMLATGGIVTSATLSVIGEGAEPEAVLPLSKLDSMLANSGGGGTANVVVQLDGRTVARAVGQPLMDEIRVRTGLAL